LDHDDLLMPDAIAEVKAAFEELRIGFVYSNAANFRGDFEPAERFADGQPHDQYRFASSAAAHGETAEERTAEQRHCQSLLLGFTEPRQCAS
jgi:hypothetical protein